MNQFSKIFIYSRAMQLNLPFMSFFQLDVPYHYVRFLTLLLTKSQIITV